MQGLSESRKYLEEVLDEDQRKQYYDLLKQWMCYSSPLTKLQFSTKIREMLQTQEQLQRHNNFLYSYLYHTFSVNSEERKVHSNDTQPFKVADSLKCMSSPSPPLEQPDIEHRSSAEELFVPDRAFLSNKIAVHAWEHGLEGADENVTDMITSASQSFIQNILTAMVSRKMGYKIRNGNFQHSFGVPVPDPFLRNTNSIKDNSQECKVEVSDDSFVPAFKPTLDMTENQKVFERACASQTSKGSDKSLDMELLFHTLREDPNIVGIDSIHTLNMLRASLALEES